MPTTLSTSMTTQYNILEHLGKMPTQIFISDHLKASPTHQEILTQKLQEARVPRNIDPMQFKTMVAHLCSTYHLNFTQFDVVVPDLNHICPLNIEAIVKHYKVKQVLINNGSSLNLCTLNFVTQVGYTIIDMHSQCITIKAYDNADRILAGMINLPI